MTTDIKRTITEEQKTGLKKLREKFKDSSIGKLPKPTKSQTDEVKKDFRKGVRCTICGGWHHPKVVHLDYVGHAAATDRILDADPLWYWEPLTFGEDSLPKFDKIGGLWINLTICGVTRIGYGNPDGKTGGNAIKETIGDAIRNAGMRFGIALDLWSKEDLRQDDGQPEPQQAEKLLDQQKCCGDFVKDGDKCKDIETFNAWVVSVSEEVKTGLDKIGNDKFRGYVEKTRKLLAPKTIECPMSKKEINLADCKTSGDCNATCQTYQEAIK